MARYGIVLALFLPACSSLQGRQPASQPNEAFLSFRRFQDSPGGTIYYFRGGDRVDSPLLLAIQGSGCNSAFLRMKNGGTDGGLQEIVAEKLGRRTAILVVEKPHVETFFETNERGARGCSEDFKRDFVRENWIGTLKKTIQRVIRAQNLQPSRLVMAGHSEGAAVAAMLAGEMPEVSHVIFGAGGGPVQLYDFLVGALKNAKGDRQAESIAVKNLLAGWRTMAKQGRATAPLFFGHSPRYWTTLAATSAAEDLKKSRAKVYIIQGTEDQSVPVESADILAAELTVAGKELVYERVPGADHDLEVNGKDLFAESWEKALLWSME